MEELKNKNVKYKILICEGDDFFPASDYAEYRWIPKSQFSTVPFYVYGNKLAILLLEEDPKIIVIKFSSVAEAYTKQFDAAWETSHTPQVKK
jgi:hypothetical protein